MECTLTVCIRTFFHWTGDAIHLAKLSCATSVHGTESVDRQKHGSLIPSPSFFCPVYWISQHSKLITHL